MSAKWRKVRDLSEFQNVSPERKPPEWLETKTHGRGISFRVRYRRNGVHIEEVLKEPDLDWKSATKIGEEVIGKARFVKKPVSNDSVRCETLCRQLVEMRKDMAPATYESTRIHFELHIIPYLNEHCPYATKLTAATYRNYRAYKRTLKPEIAIFNHWKHFMMLFKYAFEQGIHDRKITVQMEDRKKRSYAEGEDSDWIDENSSEPGKVIPKEHLQAFLNVARSVWRDRTLIQRFTGMRPGEVRRLRKSRVDFQTGEIKLRKQDTKTGQAREFIASTEVLTILRRLKLASNSPFFFPNETDTSRSMGSSLKGWHQAWARAGTNEHYTPHDLRHTFLTEMFKTSLNPALICYSAGLSLEEAYKTYLHFTSSDTLTVAAEASKLFSIA